MIIVLDKGTVIEQGSHAELMQLGGRYSDQWYRQLKGSITPQEQVGEQEVEK